MPFPTITTDVSSAAHAVIQARYWLDGVDLVTAPRSELVRAIALARGHVTSAELSLTDAERAIATEGR